jgi:hypothetical protein
MPRDSYRRAAPRPAETSSGRGVVVRLARTPEETEAEERLDAARLQARAALLAAELENETRREHARASAPGGVLGALASMFVGPFSIRR